MNKILSLLLYCLIALSPITSEAASATFSSLSQSTYNPATDYVVTVRSAGAVPDVQTSLGNVFLQQANNLSDIANAATARSNLGLIIGTNVEAWSSTLDSLAANQTANTVLGALTATHVSGLAMPSCSGASNALKWTSGTGFGCNTISGGGSGTVTSVTFTGDGTVLSSTPSSAVTTTGTLTAALATQTANTVLGALTATTPSDLAVPSCNAAGSALKWTSGTGFGCNSSITASTNANLTGPITSSGNATSIASQTGTGSTFAMSASPTFTGTVTGAALTTTGINTLNGNYTVFQGGALMELGPLASGTWLDMPTGGPSAIGNGGVGQNTWLGYVASSGQYFTDANAADIIMRNATTKAIRIGIDNGSGTANSQIVLTAGVNQIKDHLASGTSYTSAPTCGTGCASITSGSTDSRGQFTTSTSITAATLNFGTTWASAPFCVISDNSTAAVVDLGTVTTTALPVSFASSLSSIKVNYICIQ